jgi:hypothetical protein
MKKFDFCASMTGWLVSTSLVFVFAFLGIMSNWDSVPSIAIFSLFFSIAQFVLYFTKREMSLNISGIELFFLSLIVWPLYFPLPEGQDFLEISLGQRIAMSSICSIVLIVLAQSCFSEANHDKENKS